MKFEMSITDLFHLSNGLTALSGLINGPKELISACNCELVVEEQVIERIHFDGEMHLKKSDPENPLRALATQARINLTPEQARTKKFRLVCNF